MHWLFGENSASQGNSYHLRDGSWGPSNSDPTSPAYERAKEKERQERKKENDDILQGRSYAEYQNQMWAKAYPGLATPQSTGSVGEPKAPALDPAPAMQQYKQQLDQYYRTAGRDLNRRGLMTTGDESGVANVMQQRYAGNQAAQMQNTYNQVMQRNFMNDLNVWKTQRAFELQQQGLDLEAARIQVQREANEAMAEAQRNQAIWNAVGQGLGTAASIAAILI